VQDLLLYHRNINPPPEIHSFLKNNIERSELYDTNQEFYTSYPRYEICSDIKPFYDTVIKRALFDLTISFANFKQHIWCQIYKPTGRSYHGEHNHWGTTELSWVHFIKTPDKACFSFKNGQSPPQNDGDFIIFPSWVVHGISSFTEDCDRMVVVGNVELKNALYKSS
jgi:hypothetical protein|tara:strand:- start:39 stop:539 length:501 start_codon:yes stop_codon:yes gene_type:complete